MLFKSIPRVLFIKLDHHRITIDFGDNRGRGNGSRLCVSLDKGFLPDGKIQMNNKVYDTADSKELPELRAWLKETIAKFGDKDPVILRPNSQTKHERVMDVLNAASACGVTKLSFS